MKKFFYILTLITLVIGVNSVNAQSDLFFSEYLEGTSNNKAIEIFNPTGSSVDLSFYRVVRANNGSPTIQYTLPFTGILAPNDVYVMVNPSADPILLAVADIDTGTVTFFNGDDYLGLEKDVSGTWTTIDVIGILGNDPGTAWNVAGVTNATSEHTLVRKDIITIGNTDWAASAGTDSLNSEWLVYPQNTFQYLGNHQVVPVEFTSFTSVIDGSNVILNWSTATELNNFGFEVQRTATGNEFTTIGFVPGYGTTTEAKTYRFVDANLSAGNYTYRLKQIDFNGTFAHSDEVNAEITSPVQFELAQNYPNPFNPSTTIKFSIPQSSNVTLKIFNTLGQEVKTLVNQNMESGLHTINFDASELNSGIYFYRLDAGQFSEVRKMTLIK